jgi:MFS-type transporter involved in bile tolerance (Atg22 family)
MQIYRAIIYLVLVFAFGANVCAALSDSENSSPLCSLKFASEDVLYAGCCLLIAVPLTIFILKHPAYQRCLGLSGPCRTERSAIGEASTN